MLIKQKESVTSQKLWSWDFWQIADSVLDKGESAISSVFNSVFSSASDYIVSSPLKLGEVSCF